MHKEAEAEERSRKEKIAIIMFLEREGRSRQWLKKIVRKVSPWTTTGMNPTAKIVDGHELGHTP